MLVWLLDGRVLHYDADFDMWRHVPDFATFQVLDLRWCNVVSAHAGLTLTLGTAHPPTDVPARTDYPSCG